ncbi:MAG: N-acetyl-gamma-glutamyl-phosphate reductase [Pseudomonadota bacterium]
MERARVGIFGGSGLTGGELLRWIVGHPRLDLAFVHSRHHAGKPVADLHPYLRGLVDLEFTGEEPEKAAGKADVVFLAVKGGESVELARRLAEYSGIVIDLTGDHRYKPGFRYAIPELFRASLRGKNKIANPGCFATAAILAAAPLVAKKIVDGTLFFSGVTGSSGAGATPLPTTHHPFREGNLFAYKLFEHQHEPEIGSALAEVCGSSVDLVLATHSGPFVRGIHMTLHARLRDTIDSARLRETFRSFYRDSPFVRIRENPPELKAVIGSNFVDLHVASRGSEVIVLSVLDNLVKGASGQAIQNLNAGMGWDEKEGLWKPPLFP